MSKHVDFILTSIEYLMEDAVNASRGISRGICSFAVSDYIFQSLFLKMTGFSEQKAKCICWDLATEDYEFRYEYLKSLPHYGEMSSITSRNNVFKNIIEIQQKINPDFSAEQIIDKDNLLNEVKTTMIDLFSESLLIHSNHRHYMDFLDGYDKIFKPEYFVTRTNILEGKLSEAYIALYDHRNRCAHNLISYQQNLPTLKKLADDKYQYENYYVRYALLLLMDKIFINLFKATID